ncbi:MAG: hypothetical protein ACPG31_06435 [Planctomycetota bacterium]
MRFLPILPLLLVGILAGFLLADANPISARPVPQQDQELQDSGPRPFWDSINIEDDLPTVLLKVPVGKRFVLTDMWFLPQDHKTPIETSGSDILWLESQRGSDRRVVFDAQRNLLPSILRWETGVAFESGREMWINYRSAKHTEKLRRVHFTGYFEDSAGSASR